MIHSLNLASRPFRNRTLPWTIIFTLALVSLAWLVYSLSAEREAQAEVAKVELDMTSLREQTRRIELENERKRQQIPPADLQTLRDAHRLIDRKGFSWTQLFADLESAVPPSVRVARVGVRDVVQTRSTIVADISMSVVGRSSEDVTRMISAMNQSGVFVATPLTQQSARGARQGELNAGVEWTLRVNYTPRAGTLINPNAGSQARNVLSSSAPFISSLALNEAIMRGDAR